MKPSALAGRMIVVVALVWIVANIAVPPWVGRSYIPDQMIPGQMRSNGSFQLKEPVGVSDWYPLWSPPPNYDPDLYTPLRWPWQTVPAQPAAHFVEVQVPILLLNISLGLTVLGFVARLLTPATLPIREQKWIHLVWGWGWTALGGCLLYLVAWLVICHWGATPSDTGALIGFFSLLIMSSIYSLRFSPEARLESRANDDASLATARSILRASWWNAASRVGGLIAGGLVGWGLALLLIWLAPLRPSPDSPGLGGMGAAIGHYIICVGGMISGGLVGVAASFLVRR